MPRQQPCQTWTDADSIPTGLDPDATANITIPRANIPSARSPWSHAQTAVGCTSRGPDTSRFAVSPPTPQCRPTSSRSLGMRPRRRRLPSISRSRATPCQLRQPHRPVIPSRFWLRAPRLPTLHHNHHCRPASTRTRHHGRLSSSQPPPTPARGSHHQSASPRQAMTHGKFLALRGTWRASRVYP